MFGSYGSYSSIGSISAPIDIAQGKMRLDNNRCAFPSWPRRSSLSESEGDERPTSYLSDDDLFLSDPFEDDARSVSSAGSAPSPVSQSPQVNEAELLEMERARQREFVKFLVSEKERRRQAARAQRQRRGSTGAKKSPKTKLSSMTTITEGAE